MQVLDSRPFKGLKTTTFVEAPEKVRSFRAYNIERIQLIALKDQIDSPSTGSLMAKGIQLQPTRSLVQAYPNLPLNTPSPGEVNLLQTYSPCYPKSWKVVFLRGKHSVS